MPPLLPPMGAGPIPEDQGVLKLLHTRNLHLTAAVPKAGQEAVMTTHFERRLFIWTETLWHFPHHTPVKSYTNHVQSNLKTGLPISVEKEGLFQTLKSVKF